MKVVKDFFKETGLIWNKLEGVCTDGGPNMLGSRSGCVAFVKQKQLSVRGTQFMVHREALPFKDISEEPSCRLLCHYKNFKLRERISPQNSPLPRTLQGYGRRTHCSYFIHKFDGCRKEICLLCTLRH